jgi:hypothetical protein
MAQPLCCPHDLHLKLLWILNLKNYASYWTKVPLGLSFSCTLFSCQTKRTNNWMKILLSFWNSMVMYLRSRLICHLPCLVTIEFQSYQTLILLRWDPIECSISSRWVGETNQTFVGNKNSSDQVTVPMLHQFFWSKRRISPGDFVLTSESSMQRPSRTNFLCLW